MNNFEKLNPEVFPFVFQEPIYLIKEKKEIQVKTQSQETAKKQIHKIENSVVENISIEKNEVIQASGGIIEGQNKLYKGLCARGIIIAIQDSDGLREEDKEFLKSILASKKLELTDVGLLNLFSLEKHNFLDLRLPTNLQLFIGFGIKGTLIDGVLPYQKYSAEQGENDCIYIKADSLKEISSNRDLKLALWNALKPLALE